MKAKLFTYCLMLLIGAALVGCAEKFTFQRWQTIHEGMSADAVQATLGKPSWTTEQTWVYHDENKAATAMVFFDKDKVTSTQWTDSEHGILGKSPNVKQPGESEEIKAQTINK
jgi:outer membrane protein assembly factor BamE (lipoprotein component of BamABCDE complex)